MHKTLIKKDGKIVDYYLHPRLMQLCIDNKKTEFKDFEVYVLDKWIPYLKAIEHRLIDTAWYLDNVDERGYIYAPSSLEEMSDRQRQIWESF